MEWLRRLRRASRGLCLECGAALQPEVVASCTGRAGDVLVALDGLPVRACPVGHAKRYAAGDFDVVLTERLFYDGALPISRAGMFGRQTCHTCDAAVRGSSVGRVDVSGQLQIGDRWAVRVRVSAPGTTCRSCGTSQIYADDHVSSQICDAILDAFRAIDLQP